MSNVACSSILVRWRIMKISMDHNNIIRLKINLRPNGAYIFGGNVMEGKIKDEVGDRSPSEVMIVAELMLS